MKSENKSLLANTVFLTHTNKILEFDDNSQGVGLRIA